MTIADGKKFQMAIARLALIFPKKLETETIRLYWNALKSFSIEQVEDAMTHIQNTKTENFFPIPGEIIEVIRSYFPAPANKQIDYWKNLPPNPAGAAYMLYCAKQEQEWDWNEYKLFKADYLAGKITVKITDGARGGIGRIKVGASTTIVWNRG